jgi:hypothetical protein
MIRLSYSWSAKVTLSKAFMLRNHKIDSSDQNAALINHLTLALLVRRRWLRAAPEARKGPRQDVGSGVSPFI